MEWGHDFYTEESAFGLAGALQGFGGGRVVVGVTSAGGLCSLEFGSDEVAKVEVTFVTGQAPFGTYGAPSTALAAEGANFGSTRIRRWFGRDWATLG